MILRIESDDNSWQSPPPEITIEAIPESDQEVPKAPKRKSQNMASILCILQGPRMDPILIAYQLKFTRLLPPNEHPQKIFLFILGSFKLSKSYLIPKINISIQNI